MELDEQRFGLIAKWNEEKGFGFIAPRGGGREVFVHAKSFLHRDRRPKVGDAVSFEPSRDDRGRPRAEQVEFTDADKGAGGRAVRRSAVALALILMLFALAAGTASGNERWILGGYLGMSFLTFALYLADKSAALNNQWRVSEATLHTSALLGGWPGAIVAQNMYRHKTKKESFRKVFLATVVLNCMALGAVLFVVRS